ncbi:hypothetical protein D3D02_17780 [Halobellus sp. Atlit-38R]|nr:hypothetical protein D3D02_17780 [Halobellus sp. Atlit-38R]
MGNSISSTHIRGRIGRGSLLAVDGEARHGDLAGSSGYRGLCATRNVLAFVERQRLDRRFEPVEEGSRFDRELSGARIRDHEAVWVGVLTLGDHPDGT